MAEIRIKDIDEHEIDTILAEDIDFEGHLSFKKPLMIKGKFRGEIKASSSLYIGEKAYVEATIEANLVSSKGRIKGDILGQSRVELFSTAKVDGDITAPDFVAESGCKFNGYCNMGGEPSRKNAAPHSQPQPQPPQPTPQAQPQQQPHQPQPAKPPSETQGRVHPQGPGPAAGSAPPSSPSPSGAPPGAPQSHGSSHGGGGQK